MPEQRQSSYHLVRIVIDIAFIVLGSFLFLGVIELPELGFWFSWLMAVVGVMIATLPYSTSRWAGLGISFVGVYSILRILDIISAPLLQYGLALLFILIGTVNLVRGARGKSAQATNTTKYSA